ncbi:MULTISPECIES: tetratricopeptide repeat protein [unclassified Roseofilum]|uniref:tetratricopeptide repeat protein n=1 Tax=unclassified Roseofilum TaxID=2620099 RepID=UPI001B0989C1|nr:MULTISPECIES: tetratricopeptide repeat protein [unclassified Roseofilum]MBP0009677.1 tetratricopeptide repeat protein [Roseofilum sp. Belize Diploria]MBP0034041.1 tetratricopeptide repeat protein [Roseofilum sp. Belize BBD 4]
MVDWRKVWRSLIARLSQWWQQISKKLRRASVASADSSQKPPLSYTHYEFLFNQLLEGVNTQGWSLKEINQFFSQWQERTTEEEWLAWLERFGERVLGSRSPNLELAQRMVKLANVYPRPLGQCSREIGLALLERPREAEPEVIEEPQVDESPSVVEEKPVVLEPPAIEKLPIPKPPEPQEKPKENLQPPQKRPQPRLELPSLNSLSGVLHLLQLRPQMVQRLAQQMGIETNKPEEVLQELKMRALMKSSVEQEEQGNLRGAIAYVDRALSLNTQSAIAWAMKGDLLFKLQKFEQAIAAYDRTITVNPNDEQTWYNRGMAQFQLQNFELALASFEQALNLEPSFYAAWKNKAISLLNLGRDREALEVCDLALGMQPDDPVLHTCQEKAQESLERRDKMGDGE